MIAVQDIFNKVQNELGSFYSTDAHTESDIYKYIKSSLNYICNARDWGFRKKIYTLDYTAPEKVIIPVNLKTYYVLLEGEQQPLLTEEEAFLGHDGVTISVDTFQAKHSGRYEILYMPSAPEVNEKVREIDFPEHFFDVIVAMATSFARKTTEEYELANMLRGFANAEIDMIADRQTNPRPRANPVVLGEKRRRNRFF